MVRNFFAILLLISHVNVTMFIAQVDEVDVYDKKGRPFNDINTLTEYVHDVLLHHANKPRPDEDDDNARYCQIVTMPLYDFHQYRMKTSAEDFMLENKQEYALFKVNKLHSPFLEIKLPPPRA